MRRLLVLLGLTLAGCVATAKAPPSANDGTAAAAIQARNARFVMDWKARDAANLAANFYAEDVVVLPPNAPVVRGRDAATAFLRGLFDSIDATSMQLISDQVVQEGNLAYEIGRYHLSITPKGGAALTKDEGKYVVIWRRGADGAWRAVADAFNSSVPAAH